MYGKTIAGMISLSTLMPIKGKTFGWSKCFILQHSSRKLSKFFSVEDDATVKITNHKSIMTKQAIEKAFQVIVYYLKWD